MCSIEFYSLDSCMHDSKLRLSFFMERPQSLHVPHPNAQSECLEVAQAVGARGMSVKNFLHLHRKAKSRQLFILLLLLKVQESDIIGNTVPREYDCGREEVSETQRGYNPGDGVIGLVFNRLASQ